MWLMTTGDERGCWCHRHLSVSASGQGRRPAPCHVAEGIGMSSGRGAREEIARDTSLKTEPSPNYLTFIRAVCDLWWFFGAGPAVRRKSSIDVSRPREPGLPTARVVGGGQVLGTGVLRLWEVECEGLWMLEGLYWGELLCLGRFITVDSTGGNSMCEAVSVRC